mgnify:CR=1 FL=1
MELLPGRLEPDAAISDDFGHFHDVAHGGRVGNIATRFSEAPTAPTMAGIALPPSDYNWTVNSAAQRLDFNYSASVLGLVIITVRAPTLASWAPAGSPWLVNNQWNRVLTYAVSDGHKITGPGNCTTFGFPCISLAGTANNEAVIIAAGRPLSGQNRVVPALEQDYLELENLTPADMLLERNLRTAAFNDQPFAVRP